MNIIIKNNWHPIIQHQINQDYFTKLINFITIEYKNYICYPKKQYIFNAFNLTDFTNLKVVILGQDPYYKPNQANGLAFAVNENTLIPPSLKNIFLELKTDLGIQKNNTNLINWAKSGVLLLNSTLTVRANSPNSHYNQGWEIFTDNIINIINQIKTSIVFILWGNNAQKKTKLINSNKHYIIKSSHPSPLSCYKNFFGSKPFSQTNNFLIKKNILPIDWS